MKRDPLIFIKHIDECISDIDEFMSGKTEADFLDDKMLNKSVIRTLEVMGEAVKNLPNDFIGRYPEIPWADIAGTRDKLIHNYFGVDLNLTYEIIKDDLPELKKQIKGILELEV
jgi:uncharacterized protein with HEPN domain